MELSVNLAHNARIAARVFIYGATNPSKPYINAQPPVVPMTLIQFDIRLLVLCADMLVQLPNHLSNTIAMDLMVRRAAPTDSPLFKAWSRKEAAQAIASVHVSYGFTRLARRMHHHLLMPLAYGGRRLSREGAGEVGPSLRPLNEMVNFP